MNSDRSIKVAIFAVILVLLCPHQTSADTWNRVVAIVNDDVITLHELNKKIKEMTGLNPDDLRLSDENRYIATRRQILNLLIDERIAQEKIQELGIKVTQGQIDASIEKIKKDNQWTHEDLLSGLKREGITYEKYREDMKNDLQIIQLINFEVKSKIIIREEDISLYYQKHKEDFSSVGKVHLASIFLIRENPKDEGEIDELKRKGEDILARLRKGESFSELAKKFSQGPGSDEGGDMGIFETAQLEPELIKRLEAMPEGGVSDLIVRPNGIQIIKLIEKEERKVKSFEEVRDAIYSILYKGEVNERYTSWIKELRERSFTKTIF